MNLKGNTNTEQIQTLREAIALIQATGVDEDKAIAIYLQNKNLDIYEIGNEGMHIVAGHLKNMFKELCEKYVVEDSISRHGRGINSFADWRLIFYLYDDVLMPSISKNHNAIRWLLHSFRTVMMGLYCSHSQWTEKMKCATLVNILIHTLLCNATVYPCF